MSEQTKAALDEAIAAHFADEFQDESGMATGWVLQAAGILGTDADSTAHIRETAPDQAVHITLGMLEYARLHFQRTLFDDAED